MDAQRNFTVAVFGCGTELILVRLEHSDAERATADAAGRGYSFAGSIAVIEGEPVVTVEPGFEGTIASAGPAFAAMLGPWLQQQQMQGRFLRGK